MRNARARSVLAALVATMLLLAGCGGDDTADTADTTADETPAVQTEDTATDAATEEMATEDMATETATETTTAGEDLVTEVNEITDLSILASLLEEYGLTDTLQEGGPYTLFAPVDTAFDVDLGTSVEELRELPEDDVIQLLQGHVVEGDVAPEDLTPESTLTNLNGEDLQIGEGDEGFVTVGGAELTTDVPVRASNGNMYTIQSVIQPSG